MPQRAVIYIRVSTDEQALSAETQEAAARAWCEKAGHVIVEVIRDVGHSGAEWVDRPGVIALEAGARRTPRPWDMVVCRDADRIGRDATRLPRLLSIFRERGVQVVEYSTGRAMELDGVGVILVNVLAAVAQVERESIARRTRGAHASMHARGQVVGGKVYGYRNVRTAAGVFYEVDPNEGPIVRELFERRAAGAGIRELTRDLNLRGVPSPQAGARGVGAWSPSVIGTILHRERYLGVLSWGKQTKRYVDGTLVRARDGEVARVERQELALIDRATWDAVRALDVGVVGRKGSKPRHLLTGFACCDRCGGSVTVCRTRRGTEDVPAYACGQARDKGPTSCPVRLRRPLEELDGYVLEWIEREVLAPGLVDATLSALRRRMEESAEAPDTRRTELERALADADRERKNLTATLARAPDLEEDLVPQLRAARDRATKLRAELAALGERPAALSWSAVERLARERYAALGERLRTGAPDDRRAALKALLQGERFRMRMVTVNGRRRFELWGAVCLPPGELSMSPAGIAQGARTPVVIRAA